MKSDFLIALTQLAGERHLPKEQVLSAIEVALASAFKKDSPASGQNITVNLNPNTGDVSVFALKTIVETVEDSDREITVVDAQSIQKGAEIGAEIALPEPLPHNASRIAAQTAKQVVLQKLREAERELLYEWPPKNLHLKSSIQTSSRNTTDNYKPLKTIVWFFLLQTGGPI